MFLFSSFLLVCLFCFVFLFFENASSVSCFTWPRFTPCADNGTIQLSLPLYSAAWTKETKSPLPSLCRSRSLFLFCKNSICRPWLSASCWTLGSWLGLYRGISLCTHTTPHHTTPQYTHTHTYTHMHTHTDWIHVQKRGGPISDDKSVYVNMCFDVVAFGEGYDMYPPRAHLRKGTLRPHYYYIIYIIIKRGEVLC